jgi:C4-dicarboxylate-binding protein DctP
VYVPTKEERLAFKKAMMPVHQKMEARIGKEIIQAVYKDTGFKPDSL